MFKINNVELSRIIHSLSEMINNLESYLYLYNQEYDLVFTYWKNHQSIALSLKTDENAQNMKKLLHFLKDEIKLLKSFTLKCQPYGKIIEITPKGYTTIDYNREEKERLAFESGKNLSVLERRRRILAIDRKFQRSLNSLNLVKISRDTSRESLKFYFKEEYRFHLPEVESSYFKLTSFSLEEEKILKRIKFYLQEISEYYLGEGSSSLEVIHNSIVQSLDSIYAAQQDYLQQLKTVITEYREMTKKNISNMESI